MTSLSHSEDSAANLFGPASGRSGVLYLQVKRELLRRIEARIWKPGDVLPNERDLAHDMQVSIGTLRRAVDELVHEHVLVRRQGKGTFVVLHSRDRFLFQFFRVQQRDDWSMLGLQPEHEYPQIECLSFARGKADELTANALRLREGDPVIEIHNRLGLSGRPVVIDKLVISAQLFQGLTEERFRGRQSTIYSLYQTEFGITVARAHERLRAVGADRAAARVLGVVPGAPVLQVRRVAIALGGQAVEWRVSTVLSTQHEYVNLLSRPT